MQLPQTISNNITIEIVDNIDRLYSVRKEWLELEDRARDPLTYFQSFDWCEKWCRIYAPNALAYGGSLHIVLIRNNSTLTAVLPMAIESRKRLAFVLRFIGEPMIQYSKILMDAALLSQDELRNCLDQIVKNAKCDAVFLDHLVQGSSLHACLSEKECFESADAYASAIRLEEFETPQAYRASLSRSSRKSRNRKRKKLHAIGDLNFHRVEGQDPAFQKICEIALRQKQLWLAEYGFPASKLDDIRMLRMLSELGVDTGENSGVLAFCLSLNDRPLAIEIGFWRHDHYYSFLGSYDLSMAQYSPGKLLLEDAIGWTIENGFKTYDLLGNPSEYKEALANQKIGLVAYARGKTLAGNAYARMWRKNIKPSLKQTLASMPLSLRRTIFGTSSSN